MAVAVGFSGRKKSGKTTISQAVAERLGLHYASFGDFVRNEAARRHLDAASLVVLQDLGATLIQEGWPEFCQQVVAQSGWIAGTSLVVDGIRHAEAAEHLSRLVAPMQFVLVYVSTEGDIIQQRLGPEAAARITTIEKHSTEAQVTTTLPALANLTVDGALPLETVVDEIVGFLKSLS